MPAALPQLTLDLYRAPALDFESYHVGGNKEAVLALRRWSAGAGARRMWLSGAHATGKSHLLQAVIRAAGGRAMYLPLRELRSLGSGLLDELDEVEVLALDDVDLCARDAEWERALFRLFNERLALDGRLLCSSRRMPAARLFSLGDLQSRAEACLVYQLQNLDEADKAAALRAAAHKRGLELPLAVAEFILRRERRDMSALVDILDHLDRASLSEGRALTLPFVREALAALPR